MISLKQFKTIIILVSASISLISCSTVAKYSSGKTIDITPIVIQKPTVADLQVNEKKVTGTYSGKTTTISLEAIKNEAVSSALKTINADILVEPRFETTINGSLTTVNASGFPATFTNFRTMKDEDIPLMRTGTVRQVNAFIPPTVTTKKPKTGRIILGTLGLLATIYAITAVSAGGN